MLLNPVQFKHYVDRFNIQDDETKVQYIDNFSVWSWMEESIPFFECPDKEIEEVYYFRWWTYRKHIKETEDGFIITEFHPDVPWAGLHNSINAAAMHHLYEGRWLHTGKQYLNDYCTFWFKEGVALRSYSAWLADSIYKYCLVTGDFPFVMGLLDSLVNNYREWEKTKLHPSGLFWSHDDRDAMEFSISGPGLRPTLNSYMYGDAVAIAKIARISGREELYQEFTKKARILKNLVQGKLWDAEDKFFKVLPLASKEGEVEHWSFHEIDRNHNVREQLGYIPWYFNLPDFGYEEAWSQLMDEDGFYAPYGLTTAEQRHFRFMFKQEHECLWNGPSWPFATSQTLTGMANLLNDYQQSYVSKHDYFHLLKIYARCHKRRKPDGTDVRWIDENLDPYSGDWISRTILEKWGWKPEKGGYERGKDYNHSTYCDLILSGLMGIRPGEGDNVEVNPLVPEEWDYFCMERVPYHGRNLTLLFDRDGSRYGLGEGFHVLVDGKTVVKSFEIGRISCNLK